MAKYRRMALAVTLALGVCLPALAQAQDETARPAADDPAWGLCATSASKVEQEFGLPQHILTAISLAETGRSGPARQVATWPWTVHDGTKGHYFETEQEAVDFVREIRADGHRSIDVGCMQINLLHHPRAFTSVTEGFDPDANIRYAARFLKDLALTSRSWEEAVAKYHTQNPTIDEDYAPRVLAFYEREKSHAADGGQVEARQLRLASAAASTTIARSDPPRMILASAASPAQLAENLPSTGNTVESGPAILKRVFDSAR